MTAYEIAGHDAPLPELGSDIYSFDGKRLGRATAIRRYHFKVSPRWGRAYWLTNDLVHDRTPGRATLYVPQESLSAFRRGRVRPRSPEEEMQRWLLQPPDPSGISNEPRRVRQPWEWITRRRS